MNTDLTQGNKKIILQFKKFIETDFFNTEIARIRKKLKIPKDGFFLDQKNIEKYIKKPEASEFSFSLKPSGFWFQWKRNSNYPDEIKSLMENLSVTNNYIELLVRNYIYYNKFLYEELSEYIDSSESICSITDKEEDYADYSIDEDSDSSLSIKGHNNRVYEKLSKFPVSIHIHEEASQNDIIDYIKKNWKTIKQYQDKYINKNNKNSLKNSKTKENKELKRRNDFIYNNRHLSRKEIMSLVNKEFKTDLDQGSIGKIISLERKKRE